LKRLPRILLSALALTLASTSVGMVQAPDTFQIGLGLKWNWATLPPTLRSRVHASASDLPPFPIDESRLNDPKRWPPTMAIDGVVCSLRVQGGTDAVRDMRSLDDLRPHDWWYCLHYVDPSGNRFEARRGPSSCWTREGVLTERSWKTPDESRRIYSVTTYWPSGEVLMYERVNHDNFVRRPNPGLREWLHDFFARGEWLEEYFARDGSLIACAYSKQDGVWRKESEFFWAGSPIGQMDYSTKASEHSRRAWRHKE
jgi:hypothetical protein